jgi:hypothetical protein
LCCVVDQSFFPSQDDGMSEELTAYHEAGHAFVATYLGGRVLSVTIDPDWDDGPKRSGDTQVSWKKSAQSSKQLAEKLVLVALGGPVAEMIYSGDPFHPAAVAEWAGDWSAAWETAAEIWPDQQTRMAKLEDLTRGLYAICSDENHWAAIGDLADGLLAHELLERDEVEEIVGQWVDR